MSKNITPEVPVTDTTNAVHATPVEVENLISEAVEMHRSVQAVTDSFVVVAARAAFGASEAGIIGTGQRFENSEQFGNLFPNRDGKGASKATVSRWTLLGKAYSLGLTPEADGRTWGRLTDKATDKRISSAIRDAKATKAKVTKAVNSCYPGGTYKAADKAPTADSATEAGAENGAGVADLSSTTVQVPSSVSGMLDMLDVLAANLAGRTLTPAEGIRLAEVLDTLGSATVASAEVVEDQRVA